MRRWTILAVALGFVMACGTGGSAQTPSGSGDKMGQDKMMEKKDDKMMGKDKDKTMDKMDKKQHDKMMEKDKAMEKKDDKMMDKKQ
jgi:hypothetical protein